MKAKATGWTASAAPTTFLRSPASPARSFRSAWRKGETLLLVPTTAKKAQVHQSGFHARSLQRFCRRHANSQPITRSSSALRMANTTVAAWSFPARWTMEKLPTNVSPAPAKHWCPRWLICSRKVKLLRRLASAGKRSVQINVRMSAEEKLMLEQAARDKGSRGIVGMHPDASKSALAGTR